MTERAMIQRKIREGVKLSSSTRNRVAKCDYGMVYSSKLGKCVGVKKKGLQVECLQPFSGPIDYSTEESWSSLLALPVFDNPTLLASVNYSYSIASPEVPTCG